MEKLKIAVVCQRFGEEVNGGAEYYARCLAAQLSKIYDIEILTTKAVSHIDWNNWYKADLEKCDHYVIHRFNTEKKREQSIMGLLYKLYSKVGINFTFFNKLWINAQGPYVPQLIQYIKSNRDAYDVFIFITYLYYPAVFGIPIVSDKCIFVPTAHDEYMINFKVFKKLFHLPKAFVFLSEEEKTFIQYKFNNYDIKNEVAAIGIELNQGEADEQRFREKYNIKGKYIIYVGRVEQAKGCSEMFKTFLNYVNTEKNNFTLVVLGKVVMNIPKNPRIICLGFVPEGDKYDGMKGAFALWMPSEFESLSIVCLESMALGTPIIVNGKSDVLKGHCERSHAGIFYTTEIEFIQKIEGISENNYNEMCIAARGYIDKYYRWEPIMEKWKRVFNIIIND